MKKLTYAQSGVSIKNADTFVAGIQRMVGSNMKTNARAFGSPFALAPFSRGMRDPVLVSSTDGVGTKLRLAIDFDTHDTIGIDAVGMNVNDVICLGARPLFFLDYIACGKVKPRVLTDIVTGIHAGLAQADCLLVGGETAEMPGMYKANEYDIAGFCVGIADRAAMIDGSTMAAGDVVLGLASSGLHSNGYSLARTALGRAGVKKYRRALLEPTRIYVKPIRALIDALGARTGVRAVAHITGGAFYQKAVKIIPEGLGFVIKKNSWVVPPIFKTIQKAGGIDEQEMYTVFNMGIGMLTVVDARFVKKALQLLNASGVRSCAIGEVVRSSKKMVLI